MQVRCHWRNSRCPRLCPLILYWYICLLVSYFASWAAQSTQHQERVITHCVWVGQVSGICQPAAQVVISTSPAHRHQEWHIKNTLLLKSSNPCLFCVSFCLFCVLFFVSVYKYFSYTHTTGKIQVLCKKVKLIWKLQSLVTSVRSPCNPTFLNSSSLWI